MLYRQAASVERAVWLCRELSWLRGGRKAQERLDMVGKFPQINRKRTVEGVRRLQTFRNLLLVSSWALEHQENTENSLHAGGLRGRVGSGCMNNVPAGPGRRAAVHISGKGQWYRWNPSAEEEKLHLRCKLHSPASLQTTQIRCGHLTSLCGFPLTDLIHIYQPSYRGDALFPDAPASCHRSHLRTAPVGAWVPLTSLVRLQCCLAGGGKRICPQNTFPPLILALLIIQKTSGHMIGISEVRCSLLVGPLRGL